MHWWQSKGCHQPPQIARKTLEKANDQIDRFCCLRLSHHNVSTGNDSCARSRAGRHDDASRLRMRTGQDTSWWCLRGQNHHSPLSQVCAMAWRRLHGVALLLRRDRIGPGNNMAAFKLLFLTSPANFCRERKCDIRFFPVGAIMAT